MTGAAVRCQARAMDAAATLDIPSPFCYAPNNSPTDDADLFESRRALSRPFRTFFSNLLDFPRPLRRCPNIIVRSIVRFADRVKTSPATLRRILPYAGVGRAGLELPALAVELLYAQLAIIHVVKAAHVDHVFCRVRSWAVERSNPAVSAKQMPRLKGAELIRRQIVGAGEQAKSLGWDHVMQVTLLPTDGAVAFTRAREISRHLEADPSTVT